MLIHGRLDDQIKIRGNRVEPAEVAAVLAQHPNIQQSAIVVHERGPEEKILVAYVVQKTSASFLPLAEFRQFLRQRLPDHMVPGFFVSLRELPLTPNGKLDRKALPAPDIAHLQKAQAYVAPRNGAEQALVDIWKKLLSLDGIGVNDDFFDLGGHSLSATRLVSHIRKEFDVEIPLRVIFETPTIEGLARQISESQASSADMNEMEQLLTEVESLPEGAEGELRERNASALRRSNN